jgi:hypothetical protein
VIRQTGCSEDCLIGKLGVNIFRLVGCPMNSAPYQFVRNHT